MHIQIRIDMFTFGIKNDIERLFSLTFHFIKSKYPLNTIMIFFNSIVCMYYTGISNLQQIKGAVVAVILW